MYFSVVIITGNSLTPYFEQGPWRIEAENAFVLALDESPAGPRAVQ